MRCELVRRILIHFGLNVSSMHFFFAYRIVRCVRIIVFKMHSVEYSNTLVVAVAISGIIHVSAIYFWVLFIYFLSSFGNWVIAVIFL